MKEIHFKTRISCPEGNRPVACLRAGFPRFLKAIHTIAKSRKERGLAAARGPTYSVCAHAPDRGDPDWLLHRNRGLRGLLLPACPLSTRLPAPEHVRRTDGPEEGDEREGDSP